MADPVVRKEFPDQKQRSAVCYSRFGEKKKTSAFVVVGRANEYVYAKHTVTLSPALTEKTKLLPESGPGYHVVLAQFGDVKVAGIVHNGIQFETDEELPKGELTDILKND